MLKMQTHWIWKLKAIMGAHVVKSFIVYTISVLKDLKVAKLEEPLHLILHDNFLTQATPPSLRVREEGPS